MLIAFGFVLFHPNPSKLEHLLPVDSLDDLHRVHLLFHWLLDLLDPNWLDKIPLTPPPIKSALHTHVVHGVPMSAVVILA